MPHLPSGTVTFLFTDIEGSTKLWEQSPDAMRVALARHNDLVRDAIESHDGFVFKTVGDAFCAAFVRATDAVAAAISLQLSLFAEEWQTPAPLRVRVALHTGEAETQNGDYFGATLNRCHRLLVAAHAGQILLSQATCELVRDVLPEGVSLKDWGEHRLRDLIRAERIFQLLHADLPAEFPPLRGLTSFPNNLPVQTTSFVGREKEMEEVKRLLQETRLLTLTGVGGTGKTRLALQVGADLIEEYPDGVWLVELAAVSDPNFVPQVVAEALGVREEPNRLLLTTLIEHLRPKRLLLLLDNCEHLIQACARLADAILRGCPLVRLLVTSREGLWIAGEATYRVPSLSIPDIKQWSMGQRVNESMSLTHLPIDSLTQYEAVRLFIDRAVVVQPQFAVTNANAPAVAQICYQLDGIPLAIELAAARVKALPVEQIAARLDDRFHLLTGGSRIVLPRQQTLRGLIDWSYDLLSESERTLFRRLSAFVGGWTLDAAERVCALSADSGNGLSGFSRDVLSANPFNPLQESVDSIHLYDVLDLLTQLVDKSLVLYEEHHGAARYRMLGTVRRYSQDRLLESGEADVIHRRHVEYYLSILEGRDEKFRGLRQSEWRNWFETEHDNLRAAMEWSANYPDFSAQPGGGLETALRLAAVLGWLWMRHGYLSEGRERLADVLSLPEATNPTSLRARALNAAAHLARSQSDYPAAHALHQEVLAIRRQLGNKPNIAASLVNLGMVAREQGDYEQARGYFMESLSLRREMGDEEGIANALNHLGLMAKDQGEYEQARTYLEESLLLRRQLGNQFEVAASLNNLGLVAREQGDYKRARADYQESLTIRQQLDDKVGIASTLNNLGHVAQDEGDYEQARSFFEASLSIRRELGDKATVARSLNNLGLMAMEQSDYEQAKTYFEESLSIRRELGDKKSIAVSLNHLGQIAQYEGDYEQTRSFYKESLLLRRELEDVRGVAECLEKLAALAHVEERFERTARLFGAVEAVQEATGNPLSLADRADYERTVMDLCAALGEEGFAAARAQGRRMTMEEAVAYAMES